MPWMKRAGWGCRCIEKAPGRGCFLIWAPRPLSSCREDPGRRGGHNRWLKSLDALCVYSASLGRSKALEPTARPSAAGRGSCRGKSQGPDNFGLLVDLEPYPTAEGIPPKQVACWVKNYLSGAHLGNAVTNPDLAGYGDYHHGKRQRPAGDDGIFETPAGDRFFEVKPKWPIQIRAILWWLSPTRSERCERPGRAVAYSLQISKAAAEERPGMKK